MTETMNPSPQNRIRFFLTGLLVAAALHAGAQQRPIFSQYMFNPLAINPAFAGSQDNLSVAALYRSQWVNLEGAPETTTFAVSSSVPRKNIGLGMIVSRDQIGVHSEVSTFFSYSYVLKLRRGLFSMGLQGGFSNLRSDFNSLTLKDTDDPNLTGIVSNLTPNFGMGVFYLSRKFYAGFSVPYIRNTKFFDNEEFFSDARSRRYYFLTAGRLIDLNPRIQVKPEILIRVQEGAPLGADFNTKLIVDRKVALGASYRSGDALISTFELELNENFRLGYAYEYTMSGLNQFTRGTHEIMVNYRANPIGGKKDKFCATYF